MAGARSGFLVLLGQLFISPSFLVLLFYLHQWDKWSGGKETNSHRDAAVHALRMLDFRVDGLGRCMKSRGGAENVVLQSSPDARANLVLKRQATGHYLFDLSFENSIDPGYVTEKAFDALLGKCED